MKNTDKAAALLLGVIASAYLFYKKTYQLIAWLVVSYFVLVNTVLKDCHTLSVMFGLAITMVVLTKSTWEHFEEEKLEKKEHEEHEKQEKEPKPTGKSSHVDLGSTILHAYRNLSPEQTGGMKKDTKELMELQKELMGTLSEMKPAIEQGAQLLGSFNQFFGKPKD